METFVLGITLSAECDNGTCKIASGSGGSAGGTSGMSSSSGSTKTGCGSGEGGATTAGDILMFYQWIAFARLTQVRWWCVV